MDVGRDQGSEERDRPYVLLVSSFQPVLLAAELRFLPGVSTVPSCGTPGLVFKPYPSPEKDSFRQWQEYGLWSHPPSALAWARVLWP